MPLGYPQVCPDYAAPLVTFVLTLIATAIGVIAILVAVGITLWDLFVGRDD